MSSRSRAPSPRAGPATWSARFAPVPPALGADALETLEAELDERLGGLSLTPAERGEALYIVLGIGPATSAVARGVSLAAVRSIRRRLRRKLERALIGAAARQRHAMIRACR